MCSRSISIQYIHSTCTHTYIHAYIQTHVHSLRLRSSMNTKKTTTPQQNWCVRMIKSVMKCFRCKRENEGFSFRLSLVVSQLRNGSDAQIRHYVRRSPAPQQGIRIEREQAKTNQVQRAKTRVQYTHTSSDASVYDCCLAAISIREQMLLQSNVPEALNPSRLRLASSSTKRRASHSGSSALVFEVTSVTTQ